MTTLLQQAIDLAKSGERASAETLIRQVLDENPNNEVAWMWLSGVSSDILVKREALKRVLQLNPNNALAQEGLIQFGGTLPEPETIEPENADETPTETMTFDAPTAPEVADDAFPWGDDDTDSSSEEPPAVEAPVFDNIPGDFDLDLDEPPIFDIDLDTLEAPSNTEEEPLFSDEVPAIDVPPFGVPATTEEPPISDRLEQVLASTGTERIDTTDEEGLDELFDVPDIAPEDLTAPIPDLDEDLSIAEAIDTPAEEVEDIHEVLRKRRKRQNRLLIAAAAFFAVMVLGSCSLYYYVTEIADIYLLFPQFAQSDLTREAGKPTNGISEIRFQGFPASRATIHWVADSSAPTCQGGTVGLKIDFNNGDEANLYSNRNCTDGVCTFEKDLTPSPITDVTVTYLCGKDASITLHQ